ncbi:MAG: hypothetical protein IJZ23_11045 [Roseburia sp.]|nr:hypothetical protein [Roseburia sp.]
MRDIEIAHDNSLQKALYRLMCEKLEWFAEIINFENDSADMLCDGSQNVSND